MIVHTLGGCGPTPLAHYLKALGILRLVAEQADPQVRGWWEGERFRLATVLDRNALEAFFLERYQPTPLISPWNKGSGFFYRNDPGLTPAETSQASRATKLRAGIVAGRALLSEITKADEAVRAIKAEASSSKLTAAQKKALKLSPDYKKRLAEAEKAFKLQKGELIPRIRLAWRGPHREWMDAAMVLGDNGLPQYPALLGTGGNDGRFDFTNNFLQRLNEVFDLSSKNCSPRHVARPWFSGALWGAPTTGCQSGCAVGQYLPGMTGGANSGNGPTGESLLNPVDFILMMEGTVLFTAHATRRFGAREQTRAAAPFVVSAQGAGYASAAQSDESARGEQWMPLWSQPLTLTELRRLLAEGRVQIGARAAQEPLDLARAVARLGSARGITAFQRYGYIERNGQSKLAVPLGRFRVPNHSSNQLSCLDDLDAWLGRLRRESRTKYAPARLDLVTRRLSDTLFAVTHHPDESLRWQSVLAAMAEVEGVLRTGTGLRAGPIPRLRPAWVQAADDGSAAFRLGLACALQASDFPRIGPPSDPVRRHWLPLDGNRFATSGTGSHARIQNDPGVVLAGRKGIYDAIALVQRRLVEAGQGGERRLPLSPARKASTHPSDLARLLAGEVDLDRTMQLARALMALDSRQWATNHYPAASPSDDAYPDDAWLAVRLALLPWPLPDGRTIGADAAIFRRLESGDIPSAVRAALQRLLAAGVKTTVRIAASGPQIARLWAAALAFPITQQTAANFLRRLDANSLKEKTS
ncbi:MAG: type I-G CRISPR-associated protein Cas8g1/Csx17 [Desulfobacterales bacterium]